MLRLEWAKCRTFLRDGRIAMAPSGDGDVANLLKALRKLNGMRDGIRFIGRRQNS